ncbi:UDP-2,3-diacylglucosamine diphosphatase [Paenalcaligenes niemegkensis]|uniref:UDP-2,3-diacylglucosamine diphosphatase n=1 Tax=Paenalcaligenes niemegkensis TaxID=2895469 RepID=UPI001EE85E40|nr:UDP-2,3-diacylglucosamine diphosphatase [Paenalcaligenes niemegkensis]MCQ9615747.1 UDP-2,3-diacylglucosamine diphosphatase [Paenalcaligenes niemegkensis]
MRGNRDFLISTKLAQYLGAELWPDQVSVSTPSIKFVLSHGDELCTDDSSYQRFRRFVRSNITQSIYYALPLSWRIGVANCFRQRSKAAGLYKSHDITDVNPDACAALLQKHKMHTLVHGHTHRPAVHTSAPDLLIDRRIVLPDWELDHSEKARGGWLSIHGPQMVLHRLGHDDVVCDVQ